MIAAAKEWLKARWPRLRLRSIVFATLFIFSLVGLVVNLISDLMYTWVDPRIDFEAREV
jgi:ABC-type microcin C transport system permease subunit YejB